MDVDMDIDSQLLREFSAMRTTDKEVLISQFQKLLGDQRITQQECDFFLDMNNWNLQAAICSYYDFEQPKVKLPMMAFVKDITIGEGESVPPQTKFIKTWRVQNIGDEAWPPGCSLKFVGGEQFGHRDRVMVDALQPNAVADISVELASPQQTGIYQGQWRMSTPLGFYFGEIIWVIIQVEDNGLLGVTQALSSFGGELTQQSPPGAQVVDNPFASPVKYFGSSPSSMSVLGQQGSAPGTPNTPHSQETTVLVPYITPSSNIRTALFQNPQTPPQEDNQAMDDDMS